MEAFFGCESWALRPAYGTEFRVAVKTSFRDGSGSSPALMWWCFLEVHIGDRAPRHVVGALEEQGFGLIALREVEMTSEFRSSVTLVPKNSW